MTGIPRISLLAGGSPGFSANGVAPRRDATAKQIADVGAGVVNAGSAVQDIEEGIDYTRAKEASNLLTDLESKLWQNPQSGYRYAAGRNAIDRRDQVQKDYERGVRDIEKGLSNPRQLQVFKDYASQSGNRFIGQLDVHFAGQQRAWELGTNQASAKNKLSLAITGLTTPEGQKSAALMHDDLDSIADLQGFGKEDPQRAQLHQEWNTIMHGGRAAALVDGGQSKAALDYLNQHKGEIDPLELNKLEKMAKIGGLKDESLRLHQDIVRVAGEEREGLAEQRDFANQAALATFNGGKISAELYDVLVNRIDDHYRREMQVDAKRTQAVMTKAEQFLSANPLMVDLPAALQVEVAQRGLLPQVNQFARNGRYVTDPKVAAEARSMTDDEWREMSPADVYNHFRGGLDNSEWAQVEAQHARANKHETVEQRSFLTEKEYILKVARKNGILPENPKVKASDAQELAWRNFNDTAEAALKAHQDVSGKKPNDTEARQIVDAVIIEHAEQVVIDDNKVGIDDVLGTAARMAVRSGPFSWVNYLFGPRATNFGPRERTVMRGEVAATDQSLSAIIDGQRRYLKEIDPDVIQWVGEELSTMRRPATIANLYKFWQEAGRPKSRAEAEK